MGFKQGVRSTWQLVQLGKPTRCRPTATRSDDPGGRMRVPNSITRPHMGRLLVFRFKTCDTRPKPNLNPFWRSIMNSQPYLTRSCLYSMKSRPYLDGSSHISIQSWQIRPDLVGSSQISVDPARYHWIRPKIIPGHETRYSTNTTWNRQDPNRKIQQDYRVDFGPYFPPPE